jgi:hypothetical protein
VIVGSDRGEGEGKDVGQGASHECSSTFLDSPVKEISALKTSSLTSHSVLLRGDARSGMLSRTCPADS